MLSKARELYKLYGGKIFAIGKVIGKPFYDNNVYPETDLHWSGKIYALISDIVVLENPVDISELNPFIMISRQSAITSVFGSEFEQLKQMIIRKNYNVPDYLLKAIANPLPLNQITKDNYLQISNEYRRSFFLENQFRVFYVDFLLKMIGDKKKIFKECVCYKHEKLSGYADNAIYINKRYLFVEVKLNIDSEKDFKGQLEKYCEVDEAVLGKQKVVQEDELEANKVLVIDVYRLGVFDYKNKQIEYICNLDNLQDESNVLRLKSILKDKLRS